MDAKRLKQRAERLFSRRQTLDSLWQELALNFYPERAVFTTTRDWGEEFAEHLFDGSPITMRRDLGNAFSSMLRPRGREWFRATIADEELAEHPSVATWLEHANRVVRRLLYNRRSQFVRATKTGDHDFATFGNAVLSVDFNAEMDGILFRAWHLKDCVWSESVDGEVDGLWRRMDLSARQIASKGWPLSDDMRQALDVDPDKEFPVMHCMMRAEDYDYTDKRNGKFPFISVYIDCTRDVVLSEAGSHEFRYVVPRWQTICGSPYGTSPAAMTALSDGRMIQAMARVMIEAAEKTVDPPMKATEEAVKGEVNLFSRGITWVDREYDERLGPALEPIQLGKNVGLGVDMLERTRMMLSDAWYISKLTMPQQQAKTAYETAQLVEEYIRQAIPIFEPVETEYNLPLIDMPFSMLLRIGAFGEVPRELAGREIEFEFSNPLQDAIERNKVNQFGAVVEIAMAGSQLDPSVTSHLDVTKAARDAIGGSGAPADWLVDEDAAEESAEEARQMQAAAQMAQIAKPAADAVSKFSQVVPNAA